MWEAKQSAYKIYINHMHNMHLSLTKAKMSQPKVRKINP